MTNCRFCKQDYGEADTAAVKHHTGAYDCNYPCNQCKGKPECYTCDNGSCFCGGH
ncbi:hypothetical protein [Streptomyces adustus]